MSELTVIYLKATGNVLAALTRADPPAGAEPVTALVGDGLPVSRIGAVAADITVPANVLAAATIDDDQPDVMTSPQSFQVAADPQGLHPPKVETVGSSSLVLTISLATGARVALPTAPTSASLPAVVVLEKVTTPPLPPTILTDVSVTVGYAGTMVVDKSKFASGETWNMYAFVQGQPPAGLAGQHLP